jgi:hypothetical protein
MDHNVQAGLNMLKGKYGSVLTPEDVQTLENYGKSVTRANRQDAMIAQAAADRAERKASEARANEFLASMTVKDATGKPTGQINLPENAYATVLRDPTLKPAEKMSVFGFMSRVQEEQQSGILKPTDPTVAADVRSKIWDPNFSLTDLDKVRDSLSTKDYAHLRQDLEDKFRDPVRAEAMKDFETRFMKDFAEPMLAGTGLQPRSPQAMQRLDQFHTDMMAQFEQALRDGKDWRPLLDQTNAAFLGKQIAPYMLPQKDMLNTMIDNKLGTPKILEPVLERRPGEDFKSFTARLAKAHPPPKTDKDYEDTSNPFLMGPPNAK